ncbi:MAG: NADH-quinone oxidoreductase subunit L [Methanomassiliicoccales archaeon]|jgi:NADH-quinone oxidoreductase subunit L
MDFTSIYEVAWLIPLLPLISFLIVGFFGKRFKDKGGMVAIGMVGAAMVLSLIIAYGALTGNLPSEGYFETSFVWVELGSGFAFELGIYIDTLTAVMLIVVSFVATLVVIYSVGYMHEEGERRRRYFTEISLFVGVMLGLVLANNFLELFIFWELVGLCSYLLIGFWFEKPSAASAAKKAFLVTRIGDVMFMIGLIIVFSLFGSLTYTDIFNETAMAAVDQTWLMWGLFFMFGGAIGKSAQFPLHDWLPDAMEGPTTVSALIHAATMVKAGVYLVARMFPLLVFNGAVNGPNVLIFIACIGGVTAFIAATMALNSPNIKRVLAYSTISQLGYMFLALGTGGYLLSQGEIEAGGLGYSAGMFHLMNHAFFKALLFLSAGAVIHLVATEEMRKMGGLRKYMPITSLVMLIGALSIAGIPPLSGFWSKDEILASVFEAGSMNGVFMLLYVLGMATAFMTAFYMFRMWFMTFTGPEGEATKKVAEHSKHEGHGQKAGRFSEHTPKVMSVPLILLAVLAIFSGMAALFFFGDTFYGTVFFDEPNHETSIELLETIFTHALTYLSIIVAAAGILLAYFAYYKKKIDVKAIAAKPAVKPLYDMLLARYGFTKGYNWIGEKAVYGFSLVLDKFDRFVIDGLINGIAKVCMKTGKGLRKVQTGFVQTYAGFVVGGAVVMMLLMYLILTVLGVDISP